MQAGISVTPGEDLTITIGGGGAGGTGQVGTPAAGTGGGTTTPTAGGGAGGTGATDGSNGGGGGGYAAVHRDWSATLLIQAGGGGGGGGVGDGGSPAGGAGGPGGGTSGVAGLRVGSGGFGGGAGTTTGGAGGSTGGGGGGGGGWFGGGGGGSATDLSGGGGGGASACYTTDGGTTCEAAGGTTTYTAGSGLNAGNNVDGDYADDAGKGGAAGANGNPGRIVLNWSAGGGGADSDGDLTASATITEPIAISSIADTVGERVAVFDFSIADGGTADALALAVSQIVLNTSGTGTFPDITWQLNGPDASFVTGTVGAGTITFSSLSISVADGASETYTVYAYFSTSPTSTDGQTFILSVDGDTDLTVGGSGTQMGTTSAVNNSTGSTMNVVHTKLIFSTQPPSSATTNTDFSGTIAVSATDVNNSVDIDFSETITISAVITSTHTAPGGTLTSTDTGGTAKSPTNGVATWTDTKYNVAETIDIKAVSATTYTTGIFSTPVNVSVGCGGTLTFRAKSKVEGDSTTITAVAMPTGTVEGDLMIAAFYHGSGSISSLNAPAGWTLIQPASPGSEDFRTRLWYRVAQASESGPYAFTYSGGVQNNWNIAVASYYDTQGVNVNGWTLEDSSYKYQTAVSSISTTSVTAPACSLLFAAFGKDSSATISTAPSGMTLVYEQSFGNSGFATYYELNTSGAITKSITWSASEELSAVAGVFTWAAVTSDSDGDLTASATITEPIAISSIFDTVGERVAVFDFSIADGGTADALALAVSQIVLNTSGTGTFTDITWQLNGPDASFVTGTVGAGTITFSSLSISVADGLSETYTVYAYFSTSPTSTDGQTFILSVDGDTDLTVGGSGTQMGTTSAVNNSTGSTMDVVHTQLIFSTQPPASASTGSDFSGTIAVSATDVNNNVDTAFSENITISAVITSTHTAPGGTLSSTDSGGTTKTPTNGVATWTDTKYDVGETIDIKAVSATTYTAGIFSTAVACSTSSAAVTGTITPSATEAEIVSGGKTIILTLTGDTWVSGAGGGFPQVQSVTETSFPSNTTTHTVSMPATVNSGDLLIAHLTFDASASVSSTPTGWTPIDANRLNLYMKVAAGTEGGTTVDFPTAAIEAGAAQVHRISDWYGDLSGVEYAATTVEGDGTLLDPPSVTASWGAENNLWLVLAGWLDDDQLVTAYPTNYTDGLDTISGAAIDTGAAVASARRENAVATENPGTLTIQTTESWGANTFVIRPAPSTFDSERQNIINGLDSAQGEGAGWDLVVPAGIPVGNVVRTSDTVVTITLPALASYSITATETITAKVPATALVLSGSELTASPTFDVTFNPATTLYRSVGTDSANLNTGQTVQIVGTTATFSASMPDKIGVGDVLEYGSTNLAFISGRTSATVYTVKSATGGTPVATGAGTAVSVFRAYTSLFNWEAQDENDTIADTVENFDTSQNLVGDDTLMQVAAYADGLDAGASEVDITVAWVTGAGNYIRIYTPVSSSEVGVSQRHTGLAGTGYVRQPVESSAGHTELLEINTNYVRVDGLDFDGSNVTGAENFYGIFIQVASGSTDIRIENSLIHDLTNSNNTPASSRYVRGIFVDGTSEDLVKIANTIVYAIANINTNGSSSAIGIAFKHDQGASYVYNNIVFDITSPANTSSAHGMRLGGAAATTHYVKNNFVGQLTCTTCTYTPTAFRQGESAPINADNNVSFDGSADDFTGANNQINKTSYSSYFANLTAGSENFHLLADSFTLWGVYGEDVDADPNLPVTTDIDGEARDSTQPDVGPDEVLGVSAWITSTNPSSLTESNLDTATVTVEVAGGTYDASLVIGDFSLNGAPTGTTISGVVRDSATQATLTLAFNGTDFDTNASMSVTVETGAMVAGGPATTGTVTVTAVAEDLEQIHYRWRNDDGPEAGVTCDTTKVFLGTSDTTYQVPDGCDELTVKAWGAGGAGGGADAGDGGAGGGGGYATSVLSVTALETLDIVIGGGGAGGVRSGSGSGGAGGGGTPVAGGGAALTPSAQMGGGGGGGGYAAIKKTGTFLLIAGGGGGGAGGGNASAEDATAGGAGGGTNGVAAPNNGSGVGGGQGGTQSAGGVVGTCSGCTNGSTSPTAGSLNQGGDGGTNGGGGGGGGYYGGGGGRGDDDGGAGGGGGSGLGDTLTAGAGTVPGNNGDADRGTAGVGGAGALATDNSGGNGNPGRIVITPGCNGGCSSGAGATFGPAEDAALGGLKKHTIKRLRIEISNKGTATSGSVKYRLEVSEPNPPSSLCASATTWTRINSSSDWNMADSTHFTDADATSDISPGLTNANTNFVAGESKDTTDQINTGITLSTTQFTEIEYALKATNSATGGATYCFRLIDGEAVPEGIDYTEGTYGKVTLGADLLFGFRKSITIDHTKFTNAICGATISNFPVLVSLTDTQLKHVDEASPGRVADLEGDDIIFRAYDTTTCGGTSWCGLDHEIEKYDPTTGQLIAWVRIPVLNSRTASSDTVIYMYYGNSDVATSSEDINGVWDVNYKAVWHLKEEQAGATGTADVYADSTATPNGGADWVSATLQTGKIGAGQEFDGTDDYINTSSELATLRDTSSLSAWIKTTQVSSSSDFWNYPGITGIEKSNSGDDIFWGSIDTTGQIGIQKGDGARIESTTLINNDQWHHVVLTWNSSSGSAQVFVDGALETSGTISTGVLTTTFSSIGRIEDTSTTPEEFSGFLDEVRISNAVRGACWIEGQYKTQNEPGDIGDTTKFYDVGTEESSPLTFADVTTFTAEMGSQGGVRLNWRTSDEISNLGFHLYREQDGQRVRVTPEMVAGSALFAGPGTRLSSGHSYGWWDPQGRASDSYWLEDVDLDGTRSWSGPVSPGAETQQQGSQGEVQLLQSMMLSQLPRGEPLKTVLLTGGPQQPQAATALGLAELPQQWALAAASAVKLEVRERGWYRVEQPELMAAGLDAGVNPKYLQLYVQGQEQALVVRGESDESFDTWDAIEFYASGVDTSWTDAQVYWLVAGADFGQRAPALMPTWAATAEPDSFPYTLEQRERTIYVAALRNGEEENFYGPVVTATPVDQVIDVHHWDGTQDAQLEVTLQGLLDDAHQVKVLFNGVELGVASYFAWENDTTSFTVSAGDLVEGDNTVTMVAEGGASDISLIDVIRLTYAHTYMVDSDSLEFTVEGQGALGQPLTIDGFSNALIQVADVTDPMDTQLLDVVVQQEAVGYSITVGVPGAGTRTLLALTEDQIKSPAAVVANGVSSWHDHAGAEVVMIAYGDFVSSLEPLKALREAQGYSVALVAVEDLYDEFAFGVKTPWALRDFLEKAKSDWQIPPRFVLLVGDASSDPRDYSAFGPSDFVPTWMVETAILETASDDWFVDFDLDGVPDLAIGRLPVRTVSETDAAVAKILAYEAEPQGAWQQQALMVTDENDPLIDFEGITSTLKALFPDEWTVDDILRGQSGASTNAELLAKLNEGQQLVNYMGHGSTEIWGDLLSSGDIASLSNGPKLPFFVSLTCLNGFFHDIYTESLAESLIRSEQGGAIAVWASSGLNSSLGQLQMASELYRLVFQDGVSLGEAAAQAKAAVSDMDVRRSWIFFGDPLTSFGAKPAPAESSTPPQADLAVIQSDSPDPVTEGSNLTYTLTVTNNGPDQATGVVLSDTLPEGVSFLSTAPSQGTCSESAGVISCAVGTLAANSSATVTIVVSVGSTSSGNVSNTASVTGSESDPDTANNATTESTIVQTAVQAAADLSITQSDSPDPVSVGSKLTYTISVSNKGPSQATGVVLSDTLPAGVSFLSAAPSQGTCSESGGIISCALGNLAANTVATVTIVVAPGSTSSGNVSNTASVTGSESDPDGGNNATTESTTVQTTVQAAADLSVIQSDSPDPVSVGSKLTYTISVTNKGPSQATGVVLSDTLPQGVSFLSAAPSQGTCSESGGIISCALGNLAANTVATVTIVVSPGSSTNSTTISNTASVIGSGSDPDLSNTTTTESTTIAGSSVLVANFVNGNNRFLASRIYLWNPSSRAGTVTVRVFTLGRTGASSLLGTVNLGTLEATSGRYLMLAEDILAPLQIALPYTENGGNLTLEFSVDVGNVQGTARVFNHSLTLSLGTYPLQEIPETLGDGPTVLVANFTNGNDAFLASRVYLWNPSSSAGKVTARVFTLVSRGASTLLGTADLGALEPSSARNIKVAEDILAPLGIALPYTEDGGNLTLEFTIGAPGVRGAAQVFNNALTLAFGTYPLHVIPESLGQGPTFLVANWLNGNSAFFDSRVYLWNPSSTPGYLLARLFTIESTGSSRLLGTVALADLDATSARIIKLDGEILVPLGIQLPYTVNGGNLTVEFEIGAPGVRGDAQVFDKSRTLAFGTYPLQEIPASLGEGPTVLLASWLNGNSNSSTSRVYLWHPSSGPALVTVRVFSLERSGGSRLLGTVNLGTLWGPTARIVKLGEDILDPLNIRRPYMENDGNLTLEFTIGAPGVRGSTQVFNRGVTLGFGTFPMQVIECDCEDE